MKEKTLNMPDPTNDNEWYQFQFENAMHHVNNNFNIAQMALKEFKPNEKQLSQIVQLMSKLKNQAELAGWMAQVKYEMNKDERD